MIEKIKPFLTKNSPTILTVMGSAGLVTTAVLAVRATPKAIELLKFETEQYNKQTEQDIPWQDLPKIAIVKTVWKEYIPATIMGAVSIACIVGANSINLKRNAALASLYSISELALHTYQDKVVELLGEKKDCLIRDSVANDRVRNDPPVDNQIIITGGGNFLFLDELSGRYFRSNMDRVKNAEIDLNMELINGEGVTLNDFYYAISNGKLLNTPLGDINGWCIQFGKIELYFTTCIVEETGEPCIVINHKNMPNHTW